MGLRGLNDGASCDSLMQINIGAGLLVCLCVAQCVVQGYHSTEKKPGERTSDPFDTLYVIDIVHNNF